MANAMPLHTSRETQALVRRFPETRLDRYLAHGSAEVLGWLEATDARIVRALADAQTEAGVSGGVGEIGVHHGKLFILLYLALHAGERAFCIDVFDEQELNPDGSGRGDELVFRRNLTAHAKSSADIGVIRASSARVSARQILDSAGRIRLFSVDGGHSAELACNDMLLAHETLAPEGVILLDDYFEREWPGVSDGTQRFFRERRPDLVPFAIGVNKVYFARTAAAPRYRHAVRAACSDVHFREALLMDSPVDIYQDGKGGLHGRLTATPFWLSIRTTPVGKVIRRAWKVARR
jgi:hypothetical protein